MTHKEKSLLNDHFKEISIHVNNVISGFDELSRALSNENSIKTKSRILELVEREVNCEKSIANYISAQSVLKSKKNAQFF